MTKIINLYGGPGTGKSTTAAGLFHLMKLEGYEVEIVTEFAKDLTWSERHVELQDQVFVLGEQHHRVYNLMDKVDFIITDSPILLSSVYAKFGSNQRVNVCIDSLAKALYMKYCNFDIMLNRVKKYNPNGRNQTQEQAEDLDKMILSKLEEVSTGIFKVDADQYAPSDILDFIKGII